MPSFLQLRDTFNNLDKALLPEHYSFYIRGVLNSMYAPFIGSSTITENDVSGEYLETLRFIIEQSNPNMQVGDTAFIDYSDTNKHLNLTSIFKKDYNIDTIGDRIKTTLGAFNVIKTEDGYTVNDIYDYEVKGNVKRDDSLLAFAKEAYKQYKKDPRLYVPARIMGGYFMPENRDGTSRSDAMKVSINIPLEPKVEETVYETEIPENAKEFVLRGPMTPQRNTVWNSFKNLLIKSAGATEIQSPSPMPRPTISERITEQPTPRPDMSLLAQRKRARNR